MVAPFAGGSPPEGPGWSDAQQPVRVESQGHAPAQDARGAINSRPLYSNTPPPDPMSQPYPYRDSSEREHALQSPQAMDRPRRDQDQSAPGTLVDRPKLSSTNGTRRPSGSRICGKCGEPLAGQFVRALDNTYHLDCFTCHVRLP